MTREHKLALIIGFSLILLVGILISDHFSVAQNAQHQSIIATRGNNAGVINTPTVRRQSLLPADRQLFDEPPSHRVRSQQNQQPRHQQESILPDHREPLETIRMGDNPEENDNTITDPTLQRHDVRKGETLWQIAQDHYGDGNLWKKLASYNGDRVRPDGTVGTGATIILPPIALLDPNATTPTPTPTPKPQLDPEPPTVPAFTTYTVKPNDTGGEIAIKTLGSVRYWPNIVSANPDVIKDPNVVPVGAKLRIPNINTRRNES